MAETADADKIVERFGAWMQTRGLNQQEAARKIGCSAATLSQILSGQYPGNKGRYAAAMLRVMERTEQRDLAPKRPPFAMTGTAQEVISALETAHTEGCISLIMGESGLGKTVAALRYAEGEPETIYISIPPLRRRDQVPSSRSLVVAILKVLGQSVQAWESSEDVLERLRNLLTGSGRLIVVDEADWLLEGRLQMLRTINDITGCGIALLATTAMLRALQAKRSGTLQQVYNRIAYVVNLRRITEDDAEAILAPLGWDQPTIAAAAHGCAGVTRRLALGAVAAARNARRNGAKVTALVMAKAFGQLMPLD